MRGLIVGLLLGGCLLFAGCKSASTVLYAQSLPTTLTAQWDANPAADNIIAYTLVVDGGTAVRVPPAVNTSCNCVQQTFPVTNYGPHTVTVRAINLLIASEPTSEQVSPPLDVPFTLNAAPTAAKNGLVKK